MSVSFSFLTFEGDDSMATQDFKRKLTAILSADVKGYSRLMGEDEEATVRTITAHRKVITSVIEKYRGRVVDSPGDNILAEFVSVVDAVQSAVEIQEVIRAKNAELPDERRMEFRIGINLGDVIQEGERIYGDGVNIAARVEGLAEAGGICISGSAYEQIENKLALGYDYIGEHTVKNIVKPIRVYRVPTGPETVQKVIDEIRPAPQWQRAALAVVIAILVVVGGVAIWKSSRPPTSPPTEVAFEEKMAFPLPDKPSIAVLPFANLSGDASQDYLSDGTTETIITALSKISNLFVIARNSAFTYKGKTVKVQQVAEDLGVRYVLEGSVQRAGERVRINAQLVDGLTGRHLWAERYDREIGDIFALQDDITNHVVTALEVKLTEGEAARISRRQTDNTKAYEHFRRALEHLRQGTKTDNDLARRLFEKAIVLDESFADAWCFLGYTHQEDWYFGWSENAPQSLEQATSLAQKAIALDDSSPCPYMLLETIHLWRRDYEKAIAYGEKAVALEPNHADATIQLARTLTYAGRPEETIELTKKAMRLSPYYPDMYLGVLGTAYRLVGDYDEAIAAYDKRRERNPHSTMPYLGLALVYSEVGRDEEARAAASEVLKRNPKISLKQVRNRLPYQDPAEVDRIIAALRKAGLPD
jgi:adenylate cyclase